MHLWRFLPMAAAAFLAMACTGQGQQGGVQQAQAQQAGTGLSEAEDDELTVQPFDLTVGEIEEDADLLNQAGEEVGAIDSVLVDAGGRPAAIAAEVGSFAGGEERTVVIGLDRLRVDDDGDLVTTLSKEELQRLPVWQTED